MTSEIKGGPLGWVHWVPFRLADLEEGRRRAVRADAAAFFFTAWRTAFRLKSMLCKLLAVYYVYGFKMKFISVARNIRKRELGHHRAGPWWRKERRREYISKTLNGGLRRKNGVSLSPATALITRSITGHLSKSSLPLAAAHSDRVSPLLLYKKKTSNTFGSLPSFLLWRGRAHRSRVWFIDLRRRLFFFIIHITGLPI